MTSFPSACSRQKNIYNTESYKCSHSASVFFNVYCHRKQKSEQIPVLINGPAVEVIGNLKAISLHFASHFANTFETLWGCFSKIGGISGLTVRGSHATST